MKDWTVHVHQAQTFHDELLVDSHNHLDRFTDFFLPGQGHTAAGLIDYMDYLGIARICTFSYAGIGADFAYGNDAVVRGSLALLLPPIARDRPDGSLSSASTS